MRRTLFLFTILLLLASPSLTSAQTDWLIDDFHSDIKLQPDGQVLVQETISTDFLTSQKHGIYRDIPHVYRRDDGSNLYTDLTVINVTRDGASEPYTVTRNDANQRIKIGDPDTTISGPHTYDIAYQALGVISAYDTYHEFYWNVTGNDWEVPIQKASTTVTLPSSSFQQSACYVGTAGSTTPCSQQTQGSIANFTSPRQLSPGAGLTIAVGFAPNLVAAPIVSAPPSPASVITQPLTITLFTVALLAGLSLTFLRWYKLGRDPAGRRTISPEYDPPGSLRPAEIGVLVDERADTLDVSATIVDLATRGYLTIKELPGKKWIPLSRPDYELGRVAKETSNLLSYEEKLLNSLFADGDTVKISSLKRKFSDELAQVKKSLYQDVTDKKLFASNPSTIRRKNALLAVLAAVLSTALSVYGIATLSSFALGLGPAGVITGIVMLIFSFFMPRRTKTGQELYRQALGYKLFVSGTEQYRQPFFERQNIFMEVLPYAIVFGVTDKLAKAFKEMGLEPPSPTWYTGSQTFNAATFASHIDNFSTALSSTMAAAPSSSGSGGGGFSGGGSGGGGGGSW